MQNRVPVKREERPPLPAFIPVPRRNNRHDRWTPERKRAFIEALADSGTVTRAARQVNMAQTNCYTLRRAAGLQAMAAIDAGGMAGRDAVEADPDEPFVRLPPDGLEWRGELEPVVELEEWVPFVDDEVPWEQVGAEVAEAVRESKGKELGPGSRPG